MQWKGALDEIQVIPSQDITLLLYPLISTCSDLARKFYLTGDMTNLYPFIESSLEWPFSELFSANVYLIITGILSEKMNKLTLHRISSGNVTVFFRQEPASFFQVQEKLKACRNSKLNFSSCCFIANYII